MLNLEKANSGMCSLNFQICVCFDYRCVYLRLDDVPAIEVAYFRGPQYIGDCLGAPVRTLCSSGLDGQKTVSVGLEHRIGQV